MALQQNNHSYTNTDQKNKRADTKNLQVHTYIIDSTSFIIIFRCAQVCSVALVVLGWCIMGIEHLGGIGDIQLRPQLSAPLKFCNITQKFSLQCALTVYLKIPRNRPTHGGIIRTGESEQVLPPFISMGMLGQ